MALPFYYNPVTNELESTIESLGTRFGLEEISTARKTLSPTKSYTEGGRIGLHRGSRGMAMVEFEQNVPLKQRAIELLNEGLTRREVAKALESEGLIKYTSYFDKTSQKTLKNYANIETFFRKLFAAGELDVEEIGKLSKTQIERNVSLLKIIKENPDFNPDQLAKKASVDLKYKISPNVIKLLAKKEGIDVQSLHAKIFPEVKHLHELIKNNEKYLSTSIEEFSSSAKRRFLFDEMKKEFGKDYKIDNFENRLTRVGTIYIKGPGRYEKELYKTIKAPLNYAGSMLQKNMVGLVSKSFLGVISKAKILGLPDDKIKLLQDTLKGASALTDGKIRIAGDHTDIDALMKMDFETYKKEFTRINIISYALNSEKLAADQEMIKLVKDFNTGLIKPDEFKKQVETIRAKYKYLEVPLAKPILKEGKVALDYQTPRLIDLKSPRNKAILTAAENLVKNPGVIFKDIDQQLLSKNITIQEKVNILKNASPEQLKNSKYINAFSKMSGKPGKYARALKAGKFTAGAAGLWLLLTAGTTRDDKTKKETLEPGDKKQEASALALPSKWELFGGMTAGTIGTDIALEGAKLKTKDFLKNIPKALWKSGWKWLPFLWTPAGNVTMHKLFSEGEPELKDFAEGLTKAGYDVNSDEFKEVWDSVPKKEQKELLYSWADMTMDKRSLGEKITETATDPLTHVGYAFWKPGIESMQKALKYNPGNKTLAKQWALRALRTGIPMNIIKSINPLGWHLALGTGLVKAFTKSQTGVFRDEKTGDLKMKDEQIKPLLSNMIMDSDYRFQSDEYFEKEYKITKDEYKSELPEFLDLEKQKAKKPAPFDSYFMGGIASLMK